MEKQVINNSKDQEKRQPADIAPLLQQEASMNRVFKAACESFAKRERTRNEVTVDSLGLAVQRQLKEVHERNEYEKVLTSLATLGIGTLKHNTKGELVSLSNIKTTLQSIGKAALSAEMALAKFKTRIGTPKYKELPMTPQAQKEPEIEVKATKLETKPKIITPSRRAYNVFLTIMIDGQPTVFPGPNNLDPEDLGEFLANFNGLVRSIK